MTATGPGATTESGRVVGIDDDRITAFGLLHEAHRRLSRTLDRSLQEQCGVGDVAFEVVLRIGRSPDGRLMMSELACQLGLTSGGVTRLVDRVSAAGLVERTACPGDRRVQWVVLTPAGRAKLEEALTVHLADLQRELVDRLTPAELDALTSALDKLRQP